MIFILCRSGAMTFVAVGVKPLLLMNVHEGKWKLTLIVSALTCWTSVREKEVSAIERSYQTTTVKLNLATTLGQN